MSWASRAQFANEYVERAIVENELYVRESNDHTEWLVLDQELSVEIDAAIKRLRSNTFFSGTPLASEG